MTTLPVTTVASLLVSATVAFFLTPIVRNFARRQGWMDRPDGRRKLHLHPVPRLGGVAVFFAFALGCGALVALDSVGLTPGDLSRSAYVHLLIACAAVMALGVADDIVDVRPLPKLAIQALAASYLYMHGYRVTDISNPLSAESVSLGWLSFPLTVIWFVGMSNAFNLIDGLDGLAAGVGLFSTTTLFIACIINQRWEMGIVAAALGGALLGFLRYNFNPASIFLGDSGALFIGFALAAIAVRGSMKSSAVIAVAAPVMALAVPILDAGIAVLRRLVRGDGIFEADGDHIHHRLLRMGLTPRRVVIVLYGVAATFGALSLFTMTSRSQVVGLVVVATSVVTWIGVQQLGYAEFAEIQRALRHGLVNERKALGNNVYLASMADQFAAAEDQERLWALMTQVAQRLEFERIEMRVEGPEGSRSRVWEKGAPRVSEPLAVWTVPLGSEGNALGTLVLTRDLSAAAQFDPAYLLNSLNQGFVPRLRTLSQVSAAGTAHSPRLVGHRTSA